MEINLLLACVTLGVAATVVAGYMAKQSRKMKDHERRRRTLNNLRTALGG
jgi:hypothetical protein